MPSGDEIAIRERLEGVLKEKQSAMDMNDYNRARRLDREAARIAANLNQVTSDYYHGPQSR